MELDPGSPFNHFYLVNRLLEIDAIDQARAAFAEMREALPNHFMLRRTNLYLQLTVGNESAARQLLQPFLHATNNAFLSQEAMFALLALRDLPLAREQLDKILDQIDVDRLRDLIVQRVDEACVAIWLWHATGGGDIATSLLEHALSTIENELPEYTDYADRVGESLSLIHI